MKPVILITGASSGLGLSIARLLMDYPYTLILTARPESLYRFSRLGIVETDKVKIRPLDVTSSEQRYELLADIRQEFDGVDVLINNAGLSYRSVIEHVTEEERQAQMEVNFKAPMELIKLVLPYMRKRQRGKIINISSVGGMMAMPTMGVYSASKFALEGATESLYYEVKPWGIDVTLLQPGFINSDAFTRVRFTEMALSSMKHEVDPYNRHYHFMANFISKLMRLTPSGKSSVAEKVVKIIKQRNPPLRVAGTFDARVFFILRRVLPRRLYHLLLYYSLPGVKQWGRKPN